MPFHSSKTLLVQERDYVYTDKKISQLLLVTPDRFPKPVRCKTYLLSEYAVKDLTLHLKEVKKVRIQNNWVLEPISNKTARLLNKLDISIT